MSTVPTPKEPAAATPPPAVTPPKQGAATPDGRAVFVPIDKPPEEGKATGDGRHKITLGELGPTLPVGLLTAGGLVKRLEPRQFRTKQEKEMARWKKPNMNISQHVGLVLACMCTDFAGHQWSEMPGKPSEVAERRVLIAQAAMGDVLYAYCFLRREALGNIVKMNVKCPACNHAWVFPADLNTLDVTTVDSPEALKWDYTMQVPTTIRGKPVSKLRLGTTLWHCMETAASGVVNDINSKLAVLKGSVIGFNDDVASVQLMDSDVDEFHKRDLEGVIAALDDHHVGPKMALDGECIQCGRAFLQPIDWRYDAFFTTSSH